MDLLIAGCLLWHLPQHCAGDNPAHVNYMLRTHLYECFIQKSISPSSPRGSKEKEALGAPGPSHLRSILCV